MPETFRIVVITLSDRASAGEYEDLSGPETIRLIAGLMTSLGWKHVIKYILLPDDADRLNETLKNEIPLSDLLFTTGGTGIGPKDITVDTVRPFLDKELPGIMELIRVKYGLQKPAALISRSIAGVAGTTLVYTLPGSVKAVNEYMQEINSTIEHTFYMLYGIDRHK